MSEEPALTFPSKFPIKVMGVNSDSFENEIFMIANRQIPNLDKTAISSTPSRREKYLSVTVTIVAQNREQLDNLYRAFNRHPDVRMVL